MIIREEIGDGTVKTYSNREVMIKSVESGYLYDEAYDPIELDRKYTESRNPCSWKNNEEEETQEEPSTDEENLMDEEPSID